MSSSLGYPPETDIAQALLLFIFKNGGPRFEVRTSATYKPLAAEFRLSDAEREALREQNGQKKWQYQVRFARQRLVEQRLLHGSPRGIWKLTLSGIAEGEKISALFREAGLD